MSTWVVTGTATEIGKTWFASRTIESLVARGIRVAARKPAQSFRPGEGPTDADQLGAASGEAPTVVCPAHRWYEVPMAPPMAADVLGRPPFSIAELVEELAPAPHAQVRIVEGAGGPRSPIAADGDTVDLVEAIEPTGVVLVADAGLGTINAVRLCAAVLTGRPLLVALNRLDPDDDLHRRNREWLAAAGFDLVTSPIDLADRLTPR